VFGAALGPAEGFAVDELDPATGQLPRAAADAAQSERASGIRGQIQRLVGNPWFERTIIGLIVINAITLGLETSDTVMAAAGDLILAFDKAVLVVFVVEILLRMIAHGARFWRDPWSWFDMIIVGIALMPQSGGLAVLRALRILRVLRLVSLVPSLRRVVGSLLTAIPSMGAISVLLVLINYVFAVMATKLFGDRFPEWFGTIGASLYTLFQIMTLESWSMGIVRPVMEVFPYAWALFVPYIMVVTFAVLNLFIGIIVDAMSHQSDEAAEHVIEVTQSEYQKLMAEIGELRGEIRALHAARDNAAQPGAVDDTSDRPS